MDPILVYIFNKLAAACLKKNLYLCFILDFTVALLAASEALFARRGRPRPEVYFKVQGTFEGVLSILQS